MMRRLFSSVSPMVRPGPPFFLRRLSSAAVACQRRPFPVFSAAVYSGTLVTMLWLWVDERLDLRKWKTIKYSVYSESKARTPIELVLQARV